jgi:hypothetical protein
MLPLSERYIRILILKGTSHVTRLTFENCLRAGLMDFGQSLPGLFRKVDIRLHGKGISKLPWRKAGQRRHLVDVVDSDQ